MKTISVLTFTVGIVVDDLEGDGGQIDVVVNGEDEQDVVVGGEHLQLLRRTGSTCNSHVRRCYDFPGVQQLVHPRQTLVIKENFSGVK